MSVWSMVVFVSGISYSAYLLTKVLGPERETGLTGLLGGLVSSTATAMSERAKNDPGLTSICGLSIVIASMAMPQRVLIEVSVVNRGLLPVLGPPLGTMAVAGVAVSLVMFRKERGVEGPEVEHKNPFRVKPALLFGALFCS